MNNRAETSDITLNNNDLDAAVTALNELCNLYRIHIQEFLSPSADGVPFLTSPLKLWQSYDSTSEGSDSVEPGLHKQKKSHICANITLKTHRAPASTYFRFYQSEYSICPNPLFQILTEALSLAHRDSTNKPKQDSTFETVLFITKDAKQIKAIPERCRKIIENEVIATDVEVQAAITALNELCKFFKVHLFIQPVQPSPIWTLNSPVYKSNHSCAINAYVSFQVSDTYPHVEQNPLFEILTKQLNLESQSVFTYGIKLPATERRMSLATKDVQQIKEIPQLCAEIIAKYNANRYVHAEVEAPQTGFRL